MRAASDADDRGGLFPPTSWTLILSARERPELRREALEQLIRPRWKALFVLARKRGLAPEHAEDAVQGFLERLLEGDAVARLDPERGRLRAYLRAGFQNHLANLAAHAAASKRGAERGAASLDDVEQLLASETPTPEALFDRAWALALFEEALGDLEREFAQGERQGPFEILRELFRFGETAPYPELAARHGMSVPQLKAFVHRAKQRFRQLLRARIAGTVEDPAEVDVELRELLQVLGS